jgi:UDP-N-acetylmuramyl tripeptide synthase
LNVSHSAKLLDTRRLTGPNLLWHRPGAIIDVELANPEASQFISAWQEQVRLLLDAVEWTEHDYRVRAYSRGASLAISAPEDALYAATELNEAAWQRAVQMVLGETLPSLAIQSQQLKSTIAEEQNPLIPDLHAAARARNVAFLADDDAVSVGMGKGSITWSIDEIPQPGEVDWSAISDVPLTLITGTNGKSTTVRLLAAILGAAGQTTGLTSTDWIKVGDRIVDRGDYSGPGGARTLLRDRGVDTAILEVARGGILRRGLPVTSATSAAVLNVAEDHLGEYGINSLPELIEAKFVVSKALSRQDPLILNADDRGLVDQARSYEGRIYWFSLKEDNPLVKAHQQAGGTAFFLSNDTLAYTEGDQRQIIANVKEIPITVDGAARHNISNCLAACALAHSLGIAADATRAGLISFSGDNRDNPGRGNYYQFDGLNILLDFAHNVHGLSAIVDTIRQFPSRRRLIMLGQAGDRSDDDIRNLTRTACDLSPDQVIVTEVEQYRRGREPGEIPAIICSELERQGISSSRITRTANSMEGVLAALDWAEPGDFLFLQVLSNRDEVSEYLLSLSNQEQP